MSNFQISIDLRKLKNSFVREIRGRAATKRCIVIPIDDNDLVIGEKKGGVYLNLAAWETPNSQYGHTHYVKQSFTKAARDAMTDEEYKAQPILGNVKPIERRDPYQNTGEPIEADPFGGESDDLPF
ncbi:MAG: hypothetical protein LUC22_02290 [Prevotella sp.]|nr:hypothetical protein [Prevotella sp.]